MFCLVNDLCDFRIFISYLLALQLELSAFRAKWMSELRPGSGIKTGLFKAADLKKTQERVREEKVGGSDEL